jgi:NAD+ dependent glucose-6-phosphate dehydrogenase
MARSILITGAGGSIGGKLRRHFERQGDALRLLDIATGGDPAIRQADLAIWDEAWVEDFRGVDCVFHLAGDPRPDASWAAIQRLNLDLCINVYEAAARMGAKRFVFASSNWVVGGLRPGEGPLAPEIDPYPVNAYGMSKLAGERLGKSYSERWGLSVICFRIGYCQREPGNLPGTHMRYGLWGQQMWLSDGDLCRAFEKALEAPESLRFAVLNLMSDNAGMRWDMAPTAAAIGFVPEDKAKPIATPELEEREGTVAKGRHLIEATDAWLMDRRW